MTNEYTNAPRGATSDATDLDELERKISEATAGKLVVKRFADRGYALINTEGGKSAYVNLGVRNAWALVAVWNAAPALIAELRTLRSIVADARTFVHEAARNFGPPEAKSLEARIDLALAAPEVPRG